MARRTAKQADKRIPVALSMLAAVLALLGAHQTAFRGDSLVTGQPIEMASAMVASPER